ncbi:MAG: RelA/SpoT family protein [Gammaproteobacteria bacterium]
MSTLASAPASSLEDLLKRAGAYLAPGQVAKVREAYEFGARAHKGQHRLSGEPYIEHPVAVAEILVQMHMDHETLMAAMLHDVIEDTAIEKDLISSEFGSEVAELVDGVSKLTQMEFETYAQAQAHNFQKMLMAMTHDMRVILVKLADRLHNMRTIAALAPAKRRLIARETLDIYAPIAQRLGMNHMRLELEDLGFATLYPMRYRVLRREVQRAAGNRKQAVDKIKAAFVRCLHEENLPGSVLGREKHPYSIYKKMRQKRLSFSELFDVYGFRIIADNVDSCYRALGVVHNVFKPMPGKFKDYIAIPKANAYQSLHTVLFGPHGCPIEVQIRTREMDDVADAGVAAHWLFKSGGASNNSAHVRAREWLKRVLEMHQKAGDSEEFLETVKIDLFPDEIYVFTPKGDIMSLPRGATVVDLAYAVHTDIGNRCVAARVDRRLAPLRTPLQTGQTVEIITAPGAHPNPTWLGFVVTGKARSHIHHFLKNLKKDEAKKLGQRMLDRALEQFRVTFAEIGPQALERTLAELKCADMAALLTDVGLGKRLAPIVARALVVGDQPNLSDVKDNVPALPLPIKGIEGMVVSLPKCCRPIPGDPIMGLISAGRGIVIHRQRCKNLAEFRKHPDRWVDLEWAKDVVGEFSTQVCLEVNNQRGVLATVAATIADLGANIEDVKISGKDDRFALLKFVIAVKDRKHLARIMRTMRGIKTVSRVARIRT